MFEDEARADLYLALRCEHEDTVTYLWSDIWSFCSESRIGDCIFGRKFGDDSSGEVTFEYDNFRFDNRFIEDLYFFFLFGRVNEVEVIIAVKLVLEIEVRTVSSESFVLFWSKLVYGLEGSFQSELVVVLGEVWEKEFEEFKRNQGYFAERNCKFEKILFPMSIVPYLREDLFIVFLILNILSWKNNQINKLPHIFLLKMIQLEIGRFGEMSEQSLTIRIILRYVLDELVRCWALNFIKTASNLRDYHSFFCDDLNFIIFYGKIFKGLEIWTWDVQLKHVFLHCFEGKKENFLFWLVV